MIICIQLLITHLQIRHHSVLHKTRRLVQLLKLHNHLRSSLVHLHLYFVVVVSSSSSSSSLLLIVQQCLWLMQPRPLHWWCHPVHMFHVILLSLRSRHHCHLVHRRRHHRHLHHLLLRVRHKLIANNNCQTSQITRNPLRCSLTRYLLIVNTRVN